MELLSYLNTVMGLSQFAGHPFLILVYEDFLLKKKSC